MKSISVFRNESHTIVRSLEQPTRAFDDRQVTKARALERWENEGGKVHSPLALQALVASRSNRRAIRAEDAPR